VSCQPGPVAATEPSRDDSTVPGRAAVTVRVPAKLNLALLVGPAGADGYHRLATVFAALDLYDTVTAVPARDLSLVVTGPEGAGVPADHTNLAWRAAVAVAGQARRPAAVALRIDKHIPVAAGLAGGSADAAATLLACDRLWQLGLADTELSALAAGLGSDVPFALHGGTAAGTGRGEQLTPLAAPALHWVLAVADGALSTPAVYAELDRLRPQADEPVLGEDLPAAVLAGDPHRLASLLRNDLQPAALSLAPYLAATLAAGTSAGALAGLVSGSGPSCAFLAADGAHASTLAAALAASGTCRYARPVTGGVATATVSVAG
jgi:4-diphosphocytidyl-2-C-methyl-D-erythritol kinase